MAVPKFLFYNGKISKTGIPLISPDNRSFRYGDGFFETLKLVDGKVQLWNLHMDRLFSSLDLLQFEAPVWFTPAYLYAHVQELCRKNGHEKLARVRINIFRGEGGLYEVTDHSPQHIIQTWELNPAIQRLNENGLVTDIFRDAIKVCDRYSPVKSNNYLPYTMAALWAKKNKLNDAFLLNPDHRVADATIANVFIIKDGLIRTPALTEGPVNGVMRRYLLTAFREADMPVEEGKISREEIAEASEVFLTNAIYGIKWVQSMGDNGYMRSMTERLYKRFLGGF